jgi:tetratricopeptide (TPR) repeat protein
MTDRLVFAKINGWEDTLAQKQWGVRAYPTLILLGVDDAEIDRVAGYLPPAEFVSTMEDYLAGRGTLDDLSRRSAQWPDSLGLLLQIGGKYQYRGSDSLAEAMYGKVLAADPTNRSGKADSALYAQAMVAFAAGSAHYDSAVARFAAVRTRFPKSPLVEDAETYVPYVLARQEKYDLALAKYEKFLVDFPASSEVDWVKQQIEKTKDKVQNP